MHEKYLKRVGTEIYSRGIQSFHLQTAETQTARKQKECKSTQYEFSKATNQKSKNYNRQRLASFVRQSVKLIEGLLSHRNSDSTVKQLLSANNSNSDQFLSDGISFVCDALLKNRSVCDIAFSEKDQNFVAVAYSKLQNQRQCDDEKIKEVITDSVRCDGLICVWDIRRPAFPIFSLISDDEVRIIRFVPNSNSLIVGGRENGCIAAWDLTESNAAHKKITVDESFVILCFFLRCCFFSYFLFVRVALLAISDVFD